MSVLKPARLSSLLTSSLEFTFWQEYRWNTVKRVTQYVGGTWLVGLRVIELQRSDRGHHRNLRIDFAALAEEKRERGARVFTAALLKQGK